MVGRSKQPIRFVLLEFERMQKIPKNVEVAKTKRPRGFERIEFIAIRIKIIDIDRYL